MICVFVSKAHLPFHFGVLCPDPGKLTPLRDLSFVILVSCELLYTATMLTVAASGLCATKHPGTDSFQLGETIFFGSSPAP